MSIQIPKDQFPRLSSYLERLFRERVDMLLGDSEVCHDEKCRTDMLRNMLGVLQHGVQDNCKAREETHVSFNLRVLCANKLISSMVQLRA